MCKPRPSPRLHELFLEAYPLAGRAADVRSATLIGLLRDPVMGREDLKQEVLLTFWTALSRFDPSRASLRTFVERVVAAKLASLLRRSRAKKRTKHEPAEESFHLLVTVELRVDLQRLLSHLGPRERKVAQLLVEYCPTEIAHRLKISRAAVYRSISHIRKALCEGGFGA